MEEPTAEELRQTIGSVQDHHHRLRVIDQTLSSTPDPETLRGMEHTVKELPHTDDIKDTVKSHMESKSNWTKFKWVVFGLVAATIVLALSRLLWIGIAIAMQGVTQ